MQANVVIARSVRCTGLALALLGALGGSCWAGDTTWYSDRAPQAAPSARDPNWIPPSPTIVLIAPEPVWQPTMRPAEADRGAAPRD